MGLDRPGDLRHLEIAPRDREYEFLGLVNRERQVTAIDQTEDASGCPCEPLVPVDECVITRERVHQRGGLFREGRVGILAKGAR